MVSIRYQWMLNRIKEQSDITPGEDENLYKDVIRFQKEREITFQEALFLARKVYEKSIQNLLVSRKDDICEN